MVAKAVVTLEYNENMLGVAIVQSVITYDENDNEIKNYPEYVGHEFYGHDSTGDDDPDISDAEEAQSYFAKKLDLDIDQIEVEYEGYDASDGYLDLKE